MERLTRNANRADPYRNQLKIAGNPRCPSCEATLVHGSWLSPHQLGARKRKVDSRAKAKCPACRQLADRYALGIVELRGKEWKKNADQVLRTIENTEMIERNRNDQERILWIESDKTTTRIYTTLPEIARHIARTLEKSFQGFVEYRRSGDEPFLRARWWSDDAAHGHEPGAPLEMKHKGKRRPRVRATQLG